MTPSRKRLPSTVTRHDPGVRCEVVVDHLIPPEAGHGPCPDRLPVDVQPFEVVLVAGITMMISVVATIVPASWASAMRPVEGLRYD